MDLVSLAKKNYLNFEKILIDKFIDLGIKKEEMLFLLKLNDCFLKEQTIVDFKKLDQENKFKDKAENIVCFEQTYNELKSKNKFLYLSKESKRKFYIH